MVGDYELKEITYMFENQTLLNKRCEIFYLT
jgi:hypothetical protein